MKMGWIRALLTGFLLLMTAACNLPVSAPVVITVVVQPTSAPAATATNPLPPSEATPPVPVSTPSVPVPSTGEEATQAPPTEAAGPQCTINQNVNLRSGPGKAYDPPVATLLQGTVVIPTGYQPVGFPGGSWVQVMNPATHKAGWVSAGDQYLTCSIDMTTLQVVDFPPTPKPPDPIVVQNSPPKGVFDGYKWKLHASGNYFLRMEVYTKNGKKDGDNIHTVIFTITDPNGHSYTQEEDHAPYCVFGGTSGCASWPKSNGKYTLGNGGPEIVDGGKYKIDIEVDATDGTDHGSWNSFTMTVKLP